MTTKTMTPFEQVAERTKNVREVLIEAKLQQKELSKQDPTSQPKRAIYSQLAYLETMFFSEILKPSLLLGRPPSDRLIQRRSMKALDEIDGRIAVNEERDLSKHRPYPLQPTLMAFRDYIKGGGELMSVDELVAMVSD